MTQAERIVALCDELKKWCGENSLPFRSADDLAAEDVTDAQRAWLIDFIHRWEQGTRPNMICDVCGEESDTNPCDGCLPGCIAKAPPQFYSVAIYLEDRAYGGPEEGGWYYDCGVRIDSMRELEELGPWRTPRIFLTEESATIYCRKVNDRIETTINKGRREISSVLSEGRYCAAVHEGYPPTHYPTERPHYE